MNKEIMIKKALIGIVFMRIIILQNSIAIKQNESVDLVNLCFYFASLKPNRFQTEVRKNM